MFPKILFHFFVLANLFDRDYAQTPTTTAAVPLVVSNSGVDLSARVISTGGWDKISDDLAESISFAIVHMMFYNYTFNANAAPTLHAAWDYGIDDLSIYVFPCISGSYYVNRNSIQCGTATEQVALLVNYANANGIGFYSNGIAPSGYATKLKTIFLNLEEEVPNKYFDADHSKNLAFISEYIIATAQYGIEVAFYTTKKDWEGIVLDIYNVEESISIGTNPMMYKLSDNNFTIVNPHKDIPVWTAQYDKTPSMNSVYNWYDFDKAYIKQYQGGSTLARRYGSGRVCLNYREKLADAAALM